MTKKSNFSSAFADRWMSDFFESDRFLDADWLKRRQEVPAVNVVEREHEFEIEMAAPGLTKKDFNITIEHGTLTVTVEKEEASEQTDRNFARKEFNYTNFIRSFNLPDTVKTDQVDAWYNNGILKLVLHKENVKVKPKAIEVH